MPYKNIVFVKLEKRLLNDSRWFGMSDKAQLLYVKLMLGCAETYNRLPLKLQLLRTQLALSWRIDVIDSALKEVMNNFPKFKKGDDYYYFEDFEEKTNYIRAIPRNAQGIPKDGLYIDIDKEKDIDKENKFPALPPEPSESEVIREFISRGFPEKNAQSFYSYYKSQDWKTKGGISIKKNWQHKIMGWMNNQKQFNYEKRSNETVIQDDRFEKSIVRLS